MIKKYGFKVSKKKFQRTYRKASNLDDVHENGIHDYMKYIKFGFGRCSDHATKDIRLNKLTKKKGLNLVKQLDHIVPSDLYRWLKYVGWSKDKFFQIADTFRDPNVWWIKNGYWYKKCAWGKEEKFEKVLLNKKMQKKYFIDS